MFGPTDGLTAGGDGSGIFGGARTCCASGDEVIPPRPPVARPPRRKPFWDGPDDGAEVGAEPGVERPDWEFDSCGESNELMSIFSGLIKNVKVFDRAKGC